MGRPNRSASVSITTTDEEVKKGVFKIFNDDHDDHEKSKVNPIIFIGHGHDQQWQKLQSYLISYNYEVKEFDINKKSGEDVTHTLEEMLDESSIAFLVFTGELALYEKNNKNEGKLCARQNVVHELGLFQGRLGFDKGIPVVENGVEIFSNIKGIQRIPFTKGNIQEAFEDVIQTIHRHFPPRNRCK